MNKKRTFKFVYIVVYSNSQRGAYGKLKRYDKIHFE